VRRALPPFSDLCRVGACVVKATFREGLLAACSTPLAWKYRPAAPGVAKGGVDRGTARGSIFAERVTLRRTNRRHPGSAEPIGDLTSLPDHRRYPARLWTRSGFGLTAHKGIKIIPEIEHPTANFDGARPLSLQRPHCECLGLPTEVTSGTLAVHTPVRQHSHTHHLDRVAHGRPFFLCHTRLAEKLLELACLVKICLQYVYRME
jgi:hypothetical protein